MLDSYELDFFFGTLAPFLRASERPMAMACLRLFTVPPLPPFPDFKEPFFFRWRALLTDLLADLPYFRLPLLWPLLELFFFAGIIFSS